MVKMYTIYNDQIILFWTTTILLSKVTFYILTKDKKKHTV